VIAISYDVFYLINQYVTTFVDELVTFNLHVKVPTLAIRVFFSSDAVQRHVLALVLF